MALGDAVTKGPLAEAAEGLDGMDPSKMTPDQLEQYKKQQAAARNQAAAAGTTQDKPKEGSLKISISLDLDVEVHLTARIKGDIVIGLL